MVHANWPKFGYGSGLRCCHRQYDLIVTHRHVLIYNSDLKSYKFLLYAFIITRLVFSESLPIVPYVSKNKKRLRTAVLGLGYNIYRHLYYMPLLYRRERNISSCSSTD